jgi:hypothetical protein
MRRFAYWIAGLILLFNSPGLSAQENAIFSFFKEIVVRVDTTSFSSVGNLVRIGNLDYLPFRYQRDDEVCELLLYPHQVQKIRSIRLVGSADYNLIDSLLYVNNSYYRCRLQMRNLTQSQLQQFTFGIQSAGDTTESYYTLHILPYTLTSAHIYPESDELFIGEEKVLELVTGNPRNIRITGQWTTGEDIDYRISESQGTLRVHLLPRLPGQRTVRIRLQTIRPFVDENKRIIYDLPPVEYKFNVKASRLAFLSIDKKEITLDEKNRSEGVEIQMDDNRTLVMNKTYRVEDQEKPGGRLVAEIFTRNSLANNRVLCILRPYNYHRITEGYLYIKDGDEPRFITNLNITPRTTVTRVSVMHEGSDWTQDLGVYPGETVNIKIEGEGLHKARFVFEDVMDLTSDTLIRNENLALMKIKIPVTIEKRRISLFNQNENTGIALTVKEYQIPRQLDYMFVNYGDIDRNVATLKSPIIYPEGVRDVVFSFVPRRIDEDQLYGKQYLKIDVRVTNIKGQLVDMKTIDNIVVCPGENSPRYPFYGTKDCVKKDISLNSYLSKKTYELDDWARIEMNIQNKNDNEISKRIDLVLQKRYKFDLDVSFPGGLITVKREAIKDTAGRVLDHKLKYGGLYGISMAVLAQFSFYEPDKVAKLKPFRIGAGFIAMNAFNFSETAKRDVGFVVLGSIYPTKSTAKIQIPLHFGAGYMMKDQQFFFLLGPGFQFNW